jgi:hypothetical protein
MWPQLQLEVRQPFDGTLNPYENPASSSAFEFAHLPYKKGRTDEEYVGDGKLLHKLPVAVRLRANANAFIDGFRLRK